MVADYRALRDALRPFERTTAQGRELVMPHDAVDQDWTAVRDLLANALAGSSLTITAVASFPPDAPTGPIVYTGRATLFPWPTTPGAAQASLAVTATFSLDAAGSPSLRVDGVPVSTSTWTLAASLQGLAGTVLDAVMWERVAFLLTSDATTRPAYPGTVLPWVNVSGTVALSGPFANLGALLGSPLGRTLAGHVDLSRAMPVMSLTAPMTQRVAATPVPLDVAAEIETTYVVSPDGPDDPDAPPWPVDSASLVASLGIGAGGTRARLVMPLLPTGESLDLTLDGAVPLSGMSDLAPLVDGAPLPALPPEAPRASGWTLKGLDLSLALDGETVLPTGAAVSLDVGYATGGWAILPNDILTITELGLRARVALAASGTDVSGSFYGRFTFADELQMVAGLSLPDIDLSASLDDGTTASLAAVMSRLMNKLTGRTFTPPVDLTIVRLDLVASPRTGQYAFAAELWTEKWSIDLGGGLVSLGLDEIDVFIAYDGSVLTGSFSAITHIGTVELYATVATATGTGWDLRAGLVEGSSIKVLDLLKAFVYPDGTQPGGDYGVPTLDVVRLDLALSTDVDNVPLSYSVYAAVDAGWGFSIGTAELKVSAAFELEARRSSPDAPWSTEGSVSGTFSAFGLMVDVGYEFAPTNNALTFGVWYGDRGIEARVVERTDPASTVLTVRLGDLSLGEIVEFLVGLALPGETRRLPAPWDVLYKVSFRDLTLTVDLGTYAVTVDYPIALHLGFASVERIALEYTKAGGEGQVLVKLTGDFLGQPYGGASGEPLTWDVIGEPAPAVPAKGAGLVDVRYVGLGQHVALPEPAGELRTVEDVIGALKSSLVPVTGGNPLASKDTAGLRYDASSRWLFGLEAELLETVTLSAVFYDPHLYGALLDLHGSRAGGLAGLRVELVYRKVTEQIGEFSVDLRVPEAYREWEFGEVSVTLGLIHVDVYTNGNFRVDVGFPTGGDFTRAFTVQVFPFVGQGGFYFAYLNGATSERVPSAVNGTFDPVIEAGVGLAVGVGKEIHKGPLSGGLSLEVYGIFEGVYAPFHPYDAKAAPGTYFWFQGTAGVVGKLYGEVDFYVVKASVSVVARAQAVVTIEAYRATHVELHLEVSAEASVTVLFVTLHFSFDLSLDASFTLGHDSSAPWVEGPAPSPLAAGAPLVHGLSAPVPRALRQQRSQAPRRRLATMAPAPGDDPPVPWAPVALYPDGPATARLQFVPAFTVARGAEANEVEIVLLLAAENTIVPGARTAEEVRDVATDHLHHVGDDGAPAFATMVGTVMRWAALEGAKVHATEPISAAQLATLSACLRDRAFVSATFAYANLSLFLDSSLHLDVVGFPSGATPPSPTSATFVPFVPEVAASVTQNGVTVAHDYTRDHPVSAAYAANLAAYFEQLGTDYRSQAARDPLAPPSPVAEPAPPRGDGTDPTLAELLFGEYFALLTRVTVETAVETLKALPFPHPETAPSLRALAARYAPTTATVGVAKRQTLAGVAAEHGLAHVALAEAYAGGLPDGAVAVDVEVGVTPLTIAEANAAAPLAAFAFTARSLTYQVRGGQAPNAAQTLDQIAAAVPQQVGAATTDVPGPLTGAGVAAANGHLAGLLREGAALTVPSYVYTRMTGDSDAFLEQFFRVRNEGSAGVERADWYAQAIARLTPVWPTTVGDAVHVPRAYLDDLGTPVVHPLHPGDTLDRVAATFALYQRDPPGPGPTGPTYVVPRQTHEVVPADTFASVAADFPGLDEAALVAANVATDVLAPLAVVTLPDFGVAVPEHQTLAELAGVLDLAMPDLVLLVEDVATMFSATTRDGRTAPALTIPDVPSMTLDDLVGRLTAGSNEIAAQVSRFLLHGLRVPDPQDTTFTSLAPEDVLAGAFKGTLYGLYDAAGLQLAWTAPEVTIGLSTSSAWVSLLPSSVQDGKVVAGSPASEVSVTIADAPPFDGYLPSTSLALDTTAAAMPLVESRRRHFELHAVIHWQAAAQPVLSGGTVDDQSPGEPSIWLLPESLRAVARGQPQPTPAFALRTLPLNGPRDGEGTDVSGYAWAVHVPFTIRRVPASPTHFETAAQPVAAPWLPSTYLVDSADEAGEAVLRGLVSHLAANSATETATRLFLLYPPDATGHSPRGLASDATAPAPPYVLKTNLSTETRERTTRADAAVTVESFSATLAQPLAFASLLWEAVTVRGGGFYLAYEVDGKGLPAFAFDESGRAELTLLCLLGSQTGTTPGRGLLAINTCAVVTDSIDAAATQVYAVDPDGPAAASVATVPPGNVGFVLSRPSPVPPPGTSPTAAELTEMLYNLFGFAVEESGGFGASNEALPVGPAPAEESGGPWCYEQVVEASRLALDGGRVPQHCPALPPPAGDPYAGVTATAAVTVAFAAHDSFGNRADASGSPSALPLPFRYTDPVVGVGEWPATTLAYTVETADGAPVLRVYLAPQATGYLPAPGVATATALRTASAHALRFRRIVYQLGRPSVAVTATSTLAPASEAAPLPLSRARFAGFAASGYVFTSQLAGLAPLRHTAVAGDTLAGVASAYGVTAESLLAANADLDAAALFAGPVVTPVYEPVKHGAPISDLAALLPRFGNDAAPVTPGVPVVVARRSVPADATLSLAGMAAAQECAPGDIATANADLAGLLADGVDWVVRGIHVTSRASKFTSLAQAFAAAGVRTTPAQIAAANADVPGVFNPGTSTTPPLAYAVDRHTVAPGRTVASLVAAKFADLAEFVSLNAPTTGVVAQGTPLQTDLRSDTPRDGVPLRAYVERTLAITLAEFARANSVPTTGGPALPALTAGVTLLLPALLDPAALTATPYAVVAGQSLDAVAALFGTDAATLGASIQDIGGIFEPGRSVQVGSASPVTTGPEDSIASLLAKFPAPRPSLADLVAAVAPDTGLPRAGAVLVCPAPPVGTRTTLASLAHAFAVDANALARCNAALDGFLDPAKQVTYGGAPVTLGAHATLANLYDRLVAPGTATFDEFLAAVATQDLLAPGSHAILPPPAVSATAPLPATPAVSGTITALEATVTVRRPATEVAAGSDPAVTARTSALPALNAGDPASYRTFADSLEAAYGGTLRVAAGPLAPGAATRLYAVRFERPGTPASTHAVRAISVGGDPTFFALPPLCRELLSRTANVRRYRSGQPVPLPAQTETQTFRAVDAQTWAASALALVDLVLSAPYAANAFVVTAGDDGTSATFDAIVAAKKSLAAAIAAELIPVLPGTGADADSARTVLAQSLAANLTAGWETAAVVQLPTAVDATFAADGDDAGGHRLAGKALPSALTLTAATSLSGLANAYAVHVAAVAETLGGIPNLLAPGLVLTVPDSTRTWRIGDHDTLQHGADALLLDLATFATTFATTAPLFREGATVSLSGYAGTAGSGDSLETLADDLAAGVSFLAVCNQDVADLLTGTVYVDGTAYAVSGTTATLAGLAAAVPLPVGELASRIAGQAVLTAGKVLHTVALPPEHSISPAKIDLDAAAGHVTMLLGLADPARYRRLLLDLDFRPTGLEYAIAPSPLAGYESSEWLHFVSPLDGAGQPARIDTAIGQVDVPVPLRAYPTPPRLVTQTAAPSAATSATETTADVKRWAYTATFETEEAAQDVVWLKVGFNFSPASRLLARSDAKDLFTALAELVTNLPDVRADLANLLLPATELRGGTDAGAKARGAVVALADMAGRIAASWGPIAPDPPTAAGETPLRPELTCTFRMETRTRQDAAGPAEIEALVLTKDSADAWGPGAARPFLGYADDDGALVTIPPGSMGDDSLLYVFPPGVRAFTRRLFAISYPVLDAVATQSARTSIWVTRNELLVPGRATDEAFVYRTPETHFGDLAMPALVHDRPIAVGAGTAAGLAAAVTTLATDLLGAPPEAARTREKLTVRFGYRIVAGEDPDDDLVMLSPIAFRPLFAYDATVPGSLATLVETWLADNPIPAGLPAVISLELLVFSGMLPGRTQPLIELTRLDYRLQPTA